MFLYSKLKYFIEAYYINTKLQVHHYKCVIQIKNVNLNMQYTAFNINYIKSLNTFYLTTNAIFSSIL